MSKKKQPKMDRFIVRNPQQPPNNPPPSRMKQVTIESLKGVVVIDDILYHKSRLKLPTSSKQEKLKSLEELGKKIPPRHVMLSTQIGRVINKLRNDDDQDIKKAAKTVYVKWRTHFVEHIDRPLIEVKCDLKTEKLRNTSRNLLAGSLSLQNPHKLTESIERETFQIHKRMVNNGYRRTIRHLVFTLKNQEDIRNKVLSGEITVSDFVKENKKF